MKLRKIKENVFQAPAIDWDRRLFDSLIPLPDGTSYNAYLVQGSEKTVLIDSVEPSLFDSWKSSLESIPKIDFIVSNHTEQDHSGSLPMLLKLYPQAKILCSKPAKTMLVNHLSLSLEKLTVVEDGQTLSLGNKTLEFIYTPWVHWPETMCTYLKEDRILFSCDFFGSHLATSDLFATNESLVYEAAKRYYAEIMMPFQKPIEKNLQRLSSYPMDMIAPSHGPIYNRPSFIQNAYQEWVSGPPRNLVVIPFVSMHESTKKMVEHFIASLMERGVGVARFDLASADIGKLAISLVDAGTIVIGSPTVLNGPHPNAAYAALLANALRPKAKFLSVIGSYGWGGKTPETLVELLSNLKAEILPPVMSQGTPQTKDFEALDRLAQTVALKHEEAGFLRN